MAANGTDGVIVVFADPVSPELARTLDLAGYRWKAVTTIDDAAEAEPPAGWAGADRRRHRSHRRCVGLRSRHPPQGPRNAADPGVGQRGADG